MLKENLNRDSLSQRYFSGLARGLSQDESALATAKTVTVTKRQLDHVIPDSISLSSV